MRNEARATLLRASNAVGRNAGIPSMGSRGFFSFKMKAQQTEKF